MSAKEINNAHTTQQTLSGTILDEQADAPRGGGVSQVLWYAHPDVDLHELGSAIATARESGARSEDLLSTILDERPEWIDFDKVRRVRGVQKI